MRPVKQMPALIDDIGITQLIPALEADIKTLKEKPEGQMSFGPTKIPTKTYAAALEALLEAAKQDPSGAAFTQKLSETFDAYEVYGDEEWGQVYITSYYEPVIEAAKRPHGKFTQPIYGVPKDLVEVDLDSFVVARPGLSVLYDQKLEQRSARNILRGRLLTNKDPKRMSRVVVFPARAGIEAESLTEAPILAYADPIDSFFLEIQGSGVLKMGKEEMKIGYAAQNGHPYVPIGKFMLDKIPREKLTAHAIETHLRGLTQPEAREMLNRNPSYVFFKPLKGSAGITYFGTEVVPGRTIATDQTYFPKGALAFLQFERPQFASATDVEPTAWAPTSRFVIDQDTGGAIRGPHRVDLFWGRGAEAKQSSGVMKNKGRLIYFVPKLTAH
ncbi:MAG: MltA domain-containing protein [Bdellovibrionales bacterium]|nr:MltA domain-containing protein [Bdellovibrionales bacterium]